MTTATANPSVAPKTFRAGSTTYTYGPLPMAARDELEALYRPVARNPLEVFDETAAAATEADITEAGGPQAVAAARLRLMMTARTWRPDPESPEAEGLFLDNDGRPEGDERDYRLTFLAIALRQRHPGFDEAQAADVLNAISKGQLQDIWNLSLEVGPYTPTAGAWRQR